MGEVLEIISNVCSIIAFFVSLFTASRVYKISEKLSINNGVKRSNRNKVRGTIGGDFVGGDKIEGKH